MTSERAITKAIVAYLRSEGAWPVKIHVSPQQLAGTPDILVCVDGRFVALEVKTAKGRVTPLQEKRLEDIRQAGGIAAVVRSVDDVREVLE